MAVIFVGEYYFTLLVTVGVETMMDQFHFIVKTVCVIIKLHSHCPIAAGDTIISRICAGSESYPASDLASADGSARTLFKR